MIPRSMLPTLNSRVLNTLFNAVTNEEFKKLSSTNNAKEAWTILQNTYEGTKVVKNPLDEYESFDEFYAKLKDIVNSAFNLGEQIPEPKIVRKILRFLPERFHAKITTIEESKDLDSIPLTWSNQSLQLVTPSHLETARKLSCLLSNMHS